MSFMWLLTFLLCSMHCHTSWVGTKSSDHSCQKSRGTLQNSKVTCCPTQILNGEGDVKCAFCIALIIIVKNWPCNLPVRPEYTFGVLGCMCELVGQSSHLSIFLAIYNIRSCLGHFCGEYHASFNNGCPRFLQDCRVYIF